MSFSEFAQDLLEWRTNQSPYPRPEPRQVALPLTPPRFSQAKPRPSPPPPERNRAHLAYPPRTILRPRSRILIEDRYPYLDRYNQAHQRIITDIISTCPGRNRNNYPRPQPQLYHQYRVLEPEFVVINGERTLKRRAQDTELELIAADLGGQRIGNTVIIPREGSISDEETTTDEASTIDDTITAPTAQPTRMLTRLFSCPPFTKMVSTVRSAYSMCRAATAAIRNVFVKEVHAQALQKSYRISELRSQIDDLGVRNKRIKLTHVWGDLAGLDWIDRPAIEALDEISRSFLTHFHALEMIIRKTGDYPILRGKINKKLQSFQHILIGEDWERGILSPEWDLAKIFELQLGQVLEFVTPYYDATTIFRLRSINPEVHAHMHYSITPQQLQTADIIKQLLSEPTFMTLCQSLLDLCGETKVHIEEQFINRIILDLEAYSHKLPFPSYVKSEQYHQKFRVAFPLPTRMNWDTNLLLPGTFPESDEEPDLQEARETTASPSPPQSPPSPAPHAFPPSIVDLDSPARTEHLRVSFEQELMENLTDQERHDRYYVQSDAHMAIKETYITTFDEKSPLEPEDAGKIASILRNKRKHPSRTTPKRLTMHRPPKKVNFVASTRSPRQRTHLGLDVPRKFDRPATEESTGVKPMFRVGPIFSTIKSPTQPRNEQHAEEVPPVPFRDRILRLLAGPGLLRLNDDAKNEIDVQRAAVARRAAEEERQALEAARKAAEEQAQRELEERLARTGGLRRPKLSLAEPVSGDWLRRASDTLRAASTTSLATSGEGVDLRRHDFAKVVPPTEWLNDEIVNASLDWLDRAINSAAGIKDVKRNTRKCYATSSFFWKRLQDRGVEGTQRTLRRYGVTKDNILDIDTILMPICDRSHWTLVVIRPSKRTIAHMDSLNPRGSVERTDLALRWLKNILEEKFVGDDWKVTNHEAPMQTNGYDCGIHTITNAMCVALGLHPIECYTSEDMPALRIRIACVLLNGGFNGDFALGGY